MRNRTRWKAPKVVALLAATVIVGACGGTPQARSITVTFVRNAQSQANADGVLDTDIPGPSLTDEGKGQAQQLVRQLAHDPDIDAIYASAMAEAQQTAAPLASELGKQVEIIQGLQSINAGWYNGKPESMASSTYMLAPTDWLNGDVKTASRARSAAKSSTTSSPPPSARSTTAATASRPCSRRAPRSWSGRC